MYVINLSNISIKTNFKHIARVELKCVQYSEGDYNLCMTSHRSCLLHELTASQLVAIATRSDTGSHNRLNLIQSLVPPHYVYVMGIYLLILDFIFFVCKLLFQKRVMCTNFDIINLSNISIKTNFKHIARVELKCVQYSEGDYNLCMTSHHFFHSFTNVRLLCFLHI
jgi:thiamine monophosphate kinase